MTNFEKMKAEIAKISTKELSRVLLGQLSCKCCANKAPACKDYQCEEEIAAWLEQEVKN